MGLVPLIQDFSYAQILQVSVGVAVHHLTQLKQRKPGLEREK